MNAYERRFVTSVRHGAVSLAAGMRGGRRSSRRAPYFCSRAAQEVSMNTTAKNAKGAKIDGSIL